MGIGGWGTWLTGMKEGVGWNEHWVFNATEQSLNSPSETNNIPDVN